MWLRNAPATARTNIFCCFLLRPPISGRARVPRRSSSTFVSGVLPPLGVVCGCWRWEQGGQLIAWVVVADDAEELEELHDGPKK